MWMVKASKRTCMGCGQDNPEPGELCAICAAIGLAPAIGRLGDPGLAPMLSTACRPEPGDLTAILAGAPANGTITLGPGLYLLTAPLQVSQGLTLIGAGAEATRVVGAVGLAGPLVHAHLSSDATLALKDLAIVHAPEGAPDRQTDVLRVTAGRLSLTRCRVEGTSGIGGAGVSVRGDAQLEADACEVLGTGNNGIAVGGAARATLLDCALSGHGGFGLAVGATALVEATRLIARTNERGGVAVEAQAGLSLSGGTIANNGRRGILVRSSGPCSLTGIAIERNEGPGVEAVSAGRLVIDANHIRANRGAGVVMGEGARAEARANACEENALDGFAVFKGARAKLVGNESHRNGRYGVWVGGGGEAALSEDDATDNHRGGFMAAYTAAIAPEGHGPAAFSRRSDRSARPQQEQQRRPGSFRGRR